MGVTKILAMLCIVVLAGCSNSGFSGGSGGKKEKEKKPATESQNVKPDDVIEMGQKVEPPEDCTETGATRADLLTQSVINGQADQWIEYKLFTTTCDGAITPLTSDFVLFDVNATIPTAIAQPVNFEFLSDDGKRTRLHAGTFRVIFGTDLFGNAGNYFHWRTDQKTNLQPNTTSIILRMNIGTTGFINKDSSVTLHGETLSTFLRFGTMAPVEKPVRFN